MSKSLEASLFTQATDWKKAVKEAAAMLSQLMVEKEEAVKALAKAVKSLDNARAAYCDATDAKNNAQKARDEFWDGMPNRVLIAREAYDAVAVEAGKRSWDGNVEQLLKAARRFTAALESAVPYEAKWQLHRRIVTAAWDELYRTSARVDAASKNVEEKRATLENLKAAIKTQEEWSRDAKNNALTTARGAMQEAQRKQAALAEMLKECGQQTGTCGPQGSLGVVCARCGCKTFSYYTVQQRVGGDGGANWCAECMGRT
jgi:DNA repair exonuclease SbcCD ATPase subunit